MIARLILAAALCASVPAFAAETNRYAATAVPVERFEVGATLVERHGSKGTPLILIPGLASGPWAFQDTIGQFSKEHVIYVLTLPGFDGRAAVDGKGMAAAQESVRALIETRKLKLPVLIGHSLGATMSLTLAAAHPDLVRGVVAIDGLPVLPGTENWPPEQRTQMVAMLNSPKPVPTAQAFAAQQQQYMRGTGTLDMARADELAKLSGKSDPAAVMRYMADGVAIDLRSALPAIKVPVLVIAPYSPVDAGQQPLDEAGKAAYYTSLMQGTPHATVKIVSPARHFAMFDQPQAVGEAIATYLKALPQ
ncbi:alpha/beta fold hydrolase [Massilia sp. TSP1-1-2]|uniref:alpha/beta fold hydrolase n=1 Tax=Massilia sp. TSP1-1-2 TaxID=2804649 RepID=UPI003CEA70CB